MAEIYDDKGAADYVGLKPPTMRKRRREGKGPAYLKIGRLVRYRERDLVEFLEQNLIKPEVK